MPPHNLRRGKRFLGGCMPLRIVHVGLGAWGRSWARSVLPGTPDAEVVAWADPDPAARRRARTLGPVDRVRLDFRRYHPGQGTSRFNHEVLTQMSIHHFDLMRAVLGREPERISAREWSPPWCTAPAPVAVAALVEFD